MDQEGNNGNPHANYIPRDERAFAHMIEHAHEKGLQAASVDPKTGELSPIGEVSTVMTTSELAPWGIEGLKLTRATQAAK